MLLLGETEVIRRRLVTHHMRDDPPGDHKDNPTEIIRTDHTGDLRDAVVSRAAIGDHKAAAGVAK